MPTDEHQQGKNLGRSMHMAARCGQAQKMNELLDALSEVDTIEKDVALEWTDKKGNTHLHAFLAGDTDEEELDAKLGVCFRLLEEGFILGDKNDDGETALDLAKGDMKKRLPGLEKDAQTSKRGRGMSLIAEGATLKSMASTAYVVMAAGKFKARRPSVEASEPPAASGPPAASQEVMEV